MKGWRINGKVCDAFDEFHHSNSGNSVLIASMDEYHGPQLYMIEPSGEYWVRAMDERDGNIAH